MELEKTIRRQLSGPSGFLAIFCLGLLLLIIGCGVPDSPMPLLADGKDSTQRSAEQGSQPPGPSAGGNEKGPLDPYGNPITTPFGLAQWKVVCPTESLEQSVENRNGLVRFVGTGDYRLSRTQFDRTRLQVEGQWCDPDAKRTIVLAVDVSKEMDYACGLFGRRCGPDIEENDTCARATYVKMISNWAVERGHRMGFVTFSNRLRGSSTGLTFNARNMTPQVLAETFCSSDGSPDWAAPFAEVERLLAGALPSETKEIVVIAATDVASNKLVELTARVQALKGKGFHVSVALLNGADANTSRVAPLASDDLEGKKFFSQFTDGAGLLTAQGLVTRTQTTAREMNLRAIGAADWSTTNIDIDTDTVDSGFIYDTGFDVDGATTSEGYEMELIQKDLRGRTHRLSSRLIFDP